MPSFDKRQGSPNISPNEASLSQAERQAHEILRNIPGLLERNPAPAFKVPYELLGEQVGLEHGRAFFAQALQTGLLGLPDESGRGEEFYRQFYGSNCKAKGLSLEQASSNFSSAMDLVAGGRCFPIFAQTELAYPQTGAYNFDDQFHLTFTGVEDAAQFIARQAQRAIETGNWDSLSDRSLNSSPASINAFNARTTASEVAGVDAIRECRWSAAYGKKSISPGRTERIRENLFAAASVIEAFHYFEKFGKAFSAMPPEDTSSHRLSVEQARSFIDLIWTAADQRTPAWDNKLTDITSALSDRGLELLSSRMQKHILDDKKGERFRLLLPGRDGAARVVYGEELARLATQAFARLRTEFAS